MAVCGIAGLHGAAPKAKLAIRTSVSHLAMLACGPGSDTLIQDSAGWKSHHLTGAVFSGLWPKPFALERRASTGWSGGTC